MVGASKVRAPDEGVFLVQDRIDQIVIKIEAAVTYVEEGSAVVVGIIPVTMEI